MQGSPLTDGAVPAVGQPHAEPSSATLALYAADWARFTRWCRTHVHPSLPATPDTVAAFLLAMAPGLSRGTLGRLRAAIFTTHRRAGLPVPVLTAATRRALREAAASAPPVPRAAPPPTVAALLRMAARCSRDPAGLRDRALLLLAACLPGGRRIQPDGSTGIPRRALLALDAEHIRSVPEGFVLLLDDPARPVTLFRAANAVACPVRALEDWLRSSDTAYGPVFRKVDRWGNVEHARLHPDAWNRILLRRGGPARRSRRAAPAVP